MKPACDLAAVCRRSFTCALIFGCASVCAQTIKEEVRLLDKPSGAPQGAVLSAGTPAKVLERQGFWLRIEGAGRLGWIRAAGLSFSAGPGGATAIDTGRLGSGNIVATSAARGLSAKVLLNGTPRMDEVERLKLLGIGDSATVLAFMSQGQIRPSQQTVALRVPPPQQTPAASISSGSANAAGARPRQQKGEDDW